MCAIAGFLHRTQPADRGALSRLTDAMAHRGPDGQGLWLEGPVGLGHRRLAILDLSDAGRNPMGYGGEDGQRYWIVYNGEIYNYLELRSVLQAAGHRFRTATDTEVVVAAFDQWGLDCLPRFNGMWAFAIWDRQEHRLVLARDRFGIKPLYYTQDDERFVFASELKAFASLDGFTRALDGEQAAATLDGLNAAEGEGPRTLMAGVLRLMPGHAMVVEPDKTLRVTRWWETRDHVPAVPERYEEQVEAFRALLVDAVRLRLRSDRPVGASLSGGVDSGAIASVMAMLRKETGSDVHAFVATFPGTELDERPYADAVVAGGGITPHYWAFEPQGALSDVLDSIWAMEDVWSTIAVPMWSLYREMRRRNITVSLDGHGGDELLCGYHWFLDWPMGVVNDNLYRAVHVDPLPAILRNFDRCSMAHGVEVRMPLLDWRLVCFAFGLPPAAKVGGGYTKRILRDAMAGIMPEAVRRRRSKLGFNSPMVTWFNGALRPLIRTVLDHPLWLESPWWDGPVLRREILDRSEAGTWTSEDWDGVLRHWTRMNLVLWRLLFVEGERLDRLRWAS
ncbi:asparagine synthase (glutamine-hydrolyzing) [Azospirillum tabaci]|uniref:asparagine synthase (glutamine-hydrolyzing) n=1 Tax=Azospirillum tabaci TaxID=2752310 RepID=UPI0016617F6B|nr:asparagine synthase (glutamine-hydrolyzing) [Azospirillum tabaci]